MVATAGLLVGVPLGEVVISAAMCAGGIKNDYGRFVVNYEASPGQAARNPRPADALAMRRATRCVLEAKILRPFDGKTVAVARH